MVLMDHLVLPDQQAQLAWLDHLVAQDHRVPKVNLVPLELKGHEDHKDPEVIMAQLGFLGRLVGLGLLDFRVLLEKRGLL